MDAPAAEIAYRPSTGARRFVEAPLVIATPETLQGYGNLVDDYDAQKIEIVRWPAQGWRPVDKNSGDQGGTTEGLFEFWWREGALHATNEAVGDSYIFGWSDFPEDLAGARKNSPRERALVWRANYHPDGGQLFFPIDRLPFVVPLALPGDDVTPEKFVAFWCDGSKGVYIHPNIWHAAVVPIADHARFHDRQGKVHARISVDFVKEFDCFLGVPMVR
jgi:ureidoglycolate lyase